MLTIVKPKAEPLIFVARRSIRNDCMAPSRLELYDLMYLTTCAQAASKWKPDWAFCPVCMEYVNAFGEIQHFRREHA